MYHQGIARGSAVRALTVLALTGTALLVLAGPATATATTTAAAAAAAAAAGTGVTAGQTYGCTVTVGTATSTTQVPMRLTAAEPGTVGSQDTVALSAPVSALGSAFPGQATPMSVTGSAPLGGMYTGSIPMTGLTDSGNGTFRLTGHWMPRVAGPMRIFAPHQFMARLRMQTTTIVVVACAAMAPATTSTQVMVQVSAASATASAAPAAAQGAPDTGGGGSLHPADELPLVAGGAAALIAGLAITGYAVKRRQSLSE